MIESSLYSKTERKADQDVGYCEKSIGRKTTSFDCSFNRRRGDYYATFRADNAI